MPRLTWLRLAIILIVIIAGSYLVQALLQFLSGFSSIILILILAALVAYALEPLVTGLQRISLPALRRGDGTVVASAGADEGIRSFHLSRALSVGLVYVGLVILLVVTVAAFIPATVAQVNEIAPRLNSVALLRAALLGVVQDLLGRLNITTDMEALVTNIINGLQAYATPLLQNTASVLSSVLSLVGNVVLVILFSFFLALDGPRFISSFRGAMPDSMRQESRVLVVTIDRAVGGFLRSQLLQAVAVGVATGVIMSIFGVQAALVSALFAGLFMLIPLIGPLLALLPPLLATLLTAPGQLFWVIIPLFVFSSIMVNGIIPRVVGNALGLHPLVVLVALLVGFQVGGFWGAFFAVPVAGIFFTFGAFLLGRRRRLEALAGAIVQVDPREGEPAAANGQRPTRDPVDGGGVVPELSRTPAPIHTQSSDLSHSRLTRRAQAEGGDL